MNIFDFFWLVVLAAIFDMASTLYMLHIGGGEANPLMRALFGAIGPLPAMLATRGLVIAIAWHETAHASAREFAIVGAIWWVVVLWNCMQIWRQRRARS